MPGRKFSRTSCYRYGFNGQEKTNEISGEGNNYDFGERVFDPRIGRFSSIDRFTQKYPFNSRPPSAKENPACAP